MTKKDIVTKVSNETNLTQIDVKKIVQRTLDAVLESLERGETVELRNFGVFKVKTRKGRIGRNPRTGQEVQVPEKKVVVFKPGLVLKNHISIMRRIPQRMRLLVSWRNMRIKRGSGCFPTGTCIWI